MIKIKARIRNKVGMERIANMVSEFYKLDVVVEKADFNPDSSRADLKVITPSGETVVLFHMSIYRGEKHWSLGGQTFITADHCEEFTSKIWDWREKGKQ